MQTFPLKLTPGAAVHFGADRQRPKLVTLNCLLQDLVDRGAKRRL